MTRASGERSNKITAMRPAQTGTAALPRCDADKACERGMGHIGARQQRGKHGAWERVHAVSIGQVTAMPCEMIDRNTQRNDHLPLGFVVVLP